MENEFGFSVVAEQTGTGDVLHAVVDGQRFVLRMRAVEGLYVLVGAAEIVGDVVLYIPVGVGIVGHEEVHSVAVGRVCSRDLLRAPDG